MVVGETIAAIATAPGRGGVAIVRVSGPDAFAIAERLTGRPVRIGRISFACLSAEGRTLDEAVVLAFRAPHSYTGEDVVEFQCHGGTVTPRRVLEACFAAGARLARRGEFTQRAFLNGKLDYDQAASVLDLIDARTGRSADAALAGLSGRRHQTCRALYDETLSIGAEVEHALDIDEGELPETFLPEISARVSHLLERVSAALARAREGKILREGALVVLAGPPNVGKSSLMNALLRENRAIVSDTPGTTRDAIEAWLDLEGWPIRLVDTAGLRETDDAVEAEGVRRARALAARAVLVLRLVDATALPSGVSRKSTVLNRPFVQSPKSTVLSLGQKTLDFGRTVGEGPTTLTVLTKADLMSDEARRAVTAESDVLAVSARTGLGLDDLRRTICQALETRCGSAADAGAAIDAAVTDGYAAREVSADGCDADATDLSEQDTAVLHEVKAQLRILCGQNDLVLLGNGLRQAAERLGTLIGATYSADLLDRLFSRFCVGK